MSRSVVIRMVLLITATGAVMALTPFIGMRLITLSQLGGNEQSRHIFFAIRLPRTLAAFFAGGGLALAGMIFQAMFRNPLATPFTLGISSGASFGAAATILLGLTGAGFAGMPAVSYGAFAGALCAMLLVYAISVSRPTSSGNTMLLAGVAMSFIFSSLLLFCQFLSNLRHSFQIVRWLMGGLEIYGYRPLAAMLPFVAVGSGIAMLLLPRLDHLMTGEEIAKTRGINVEQTKKLLLLLNSVITGSIVALCGPIGFVGMMAPHICRMVFGVSHRVLGPASFLFGGMFLVLCDTAARTIITPAEIPVGVITALMGGPFFLWLLLRRGDVGRIWR